MKEFCCFSEAIREGAKSRPQGFGYLSRNGATCAVGAGMEALGMSAYEEDLMAPRQLKETYQYLAGGRKVECPVSGCDKGPYDSLLECVYDLNDIHHWSREQIADWLESEENKLGFVTLIENQSEVSKPELAHTV